MKRRGFLKGLLGAAAVTPALTTTEPAEATPRAEAAAHAPPEDDDAVHALLLERIRHDPVVQELVRRAVDEKIGLLAKPPVIRYAPATITADSTNDPWYPPPGVIYPDTPIEVVTFPRLPDPRPPLPPGHAYAFAYEDVMHALDDTIVPLFGAS